jgi:hypothetical protein
MRHHLCHVHFAPLPLSCRLKLVDTPDYFINRIWLKQILHKDCSRVSG